MLNFMTVLSPKDILNLVLVFLFWLAPTFYGIGSLIYFIRNYRNRIKKQDKKLSLILLAINFFNCLWGWMSLFLFLMLLWGSHLDEIFVWFGLIVQGFFIYVIPFINLILFILKNKQNNEVKSEYGNVI